MQKHTEPEEATMPEPTTIPERAEHVARMLRHQHSDLRQGAYFEPREDPAWDITPVAADLIEELAAEVRGLRWAIESALDDLDAGKQYDADATLRRAVRT